MNIMAQVPLEKKINMSYSAEELLLTCFFDGMSCDARSGGEVALSSCELEVLILGPFVCAYSLPVGVGSQRCCSPAFL
jgi:hypothetical protein